MNKIIGIYKITNTITGDFYIGSSKNIKQRWAQHKKSSTWKRCPNNQMYLDMQKYGIDKFVFEILEEVEENSLKETEQQFIETLSPTYNSNRANGWDIERSKESQRKAQKKYEKTEKRKKAKKEYNKEYRKSERYKEHQKEYDNQLCSYNGETITLCALRMRFKRKGLSNPTQEAKKYLLNKPKDNIKE